MDFMLCPTLVIIDAIVLEQEAIYYRPLREILNTPVTVVKGLELSKIEKGYELSFLMYNHTQESEECLWYYTVKGRSIEMIY